MKNICIFSSFFFLITAILAFYKKYYVYGFLFLLLLTTSLNIRFYNNTYSHILDQVTIISIVIYGAFLFYKKCSSKPLNNRIIILQFLVLLAFFITIYLYYYGYYTNEYCFHENKNIGNLYHSLLHIISSYGHNIIIIM